MPQGLNTISVNAPMTSTLDVNKYATKKTIAQGLLDIALLTANASQLKFILQVGEEHQFYLLMLILISTSIILQVIQAALCVILGGSYDINKEHHQDNANKTNNIIMVVNIVIMAVNVIINSFEMKSEYLINMFHAAKTSTTTIASTIKS
ncbi:ninjurin-A isoform X2 [Diabrotica virgifera virgifera]|uniref:Ninjurin-2-like isoform X2 n=1 Tax=Diabrotica virgifera virgifera TaxID=50390 RepID=A0A6P7EZS3_DIAVI|nr:ninjurin-A isoform X2 [Diabrotica virgifera virgifera]